MFFRSMQFGDQWMDSRSGNFYIMWYFSSSPQVSSILKVSLFLIFCFTSLLPVLKFGDFSVTPFKYSIFVRYYLLLPHFRLLVTDKP